MNVSSGRGHRERIDPRTEHRNIGETVITDITGDDRQAMVEGRRRNDEIRLRESMPGLAAVLDHQPPPEHPR